MVDGDYRTAGSRGFGTTFDLAGGIATPYLSKIPGMNCNVGNVASEFAWSTAKYAAGKLDTMLDKSALRMYAVPPGPRLGTLALKQTEVKAVNLLGKIGANGAAPSALKNGEFTPIRFGDDEQVYVKLPAPSNPDVMRWQRMNGDDMSKTGGAVLDAPAIESSSFAQKMDVLRRAGYEVNANPLLQARGEFSPGKVFEYHPETMTRLDLAHEWQHFGQLQQMEANGLKLNSRNQRYFSSGS